MPGLIVTANACSCSLERVRWASFHIVFLLCCLSPLALGQVTADANLILGDRVFTASKVYCLLQSHFFSAQTSSAPDLDGLYKNYLHKVLSSDVRRELDLATIEFVSQLRNGHTFFWDARLDKDNNEPLGFYVAPLGGKWVVQTSFLDNLKPGDTISAIDDMAIEAFFLQQRRYISASSTAAQRRNLFLFPYLFPEQFTLRLEGGRQVAVNRASLKKRSEKTEGRWVKPGAIAQQLADILGRTVYAWKDGLFFTKYLDSTTPYSHSATGDEHILDTYKGPVYLIPWGGFTKLPCAFVPGQPEPIRCAGPRPRPGL